MELIPTIIQDYKTLEVYMLGYSNKESLGKTVKTGFVFFWSRSRKKLWMKGEKSDNKLKIVNIYFDCYKDAILIKIKLIGKNVCHTGNLSCFFNKFK
ncbi:phosphoribosyl-AMP cyclohydrolase [Candidatus Roizmanbacteria bacterium CG03_land_8_20_14_0_80_35_26]|uniref:Histidine biosynthesis bifunctional protein HisIE n=2 Tax=Candidatus Roizmaniibacteriota TaxID=1752723 RepID=A0A2M7BWR7_9BACT|nr:MAG: phosphoribosyl-AMP cyclohydrolase [Candidatus Roizmanbacteria bacterium CG03_land_8_20_14_0_80_35_26]PJC32832.1 MAG: phosphoribosyl-AMP cyclohydrolase [Candidatus Roizmanbacteria bacterium CG_4_9_14_0_2_um_filter_36_12]PJC80137.1 MAG: phosphoribosyl-AMP cyclohydrolase [Candidatus Roizmanbacteria bacterium CG_4_8_14_3_um_filter_36_12]